MSTIPTDPIPAPPIRGLTCSEIAAQQDRRLHELCEHKVNRLSCRCSGCDSDERYPVITGPQDAPLLNTGYDIATGGALTGGNDAQWEAGIGTNAGPSSVTATSWIKAFIVV